MPINAGMISALVFLTGAALGVLVGYLAMGVVARRSAVAVAAGGLVLAGVGRAYDSFDEYSEPFAGPLTTVGLALVLLGAFVAGVALGGALRITGIAVVERKVSSLPAGTLLGVGALLVAVVAANSALGFLWGGSRLNPLLVVGVFGAAVGAATRVRLPRWLAVALVAVGLVLATAGWGQYNDYADSGPLMGPLLLLGGLAFAAAALTGGMAAGSGLRRAHD